MNKDVFKLDEENARIQEEQSKKHEREIDDLQKILKAPEGRRFVLRLLTEVGLFRTSFSLNSMQTAFNEGKRELGLWLLKEMDEAEPFAYTQMLREYYSELKGKKKQEDENGRD